MPTPFRSHARGGCIPRRDGWGYLSVLPETGSRLSHSRSRSQAATLKFRSSARWRIEPCHAGGIPKGKALWSLLPTSGEAEVGPRREYKRHLQTPSCIAKKQNTPARHGTRAYCFVVPPNFGDRSPFCPVWWGSLRFRRMPYTPAPALSFPGSSARAFSRRPAL